MTSYSEWTQQVGDQWVAAIKRAEEAASQSAKNVQDATAKVELPELPVPEQVSKFQEAIAANLPKPEEIVQANYELTTRLIEAQRELTLHMLSLAKTSDTSKKA